MSRCSCLRFRMFVAWILISLFFLTFPFPNYCFSVDLFVADVVFGYCNKFFFALFHVVSCICINTSTIFSMLVCPLPPSLLDMYRLCHLSDIRPYASSVIFLFICWNSSLVHFKNSPNILRGENPRRLSLSWDS